MTHKPCLLCRQSQEIQTEVLKRARTQRYGDIVEWLNDQDIPARYDQVRYFISRSGVTTRLQPIQPVKGYKNKVRVYIGALLAHDAPNFTINNLRLHGSSWTGVTARLHKDGMIKPMRDYSPKRWQILATKDELRAWCKVQDDR